MFITIYIYKYILCLPFSSHIIFYKFLIILSWKCNYSLSLDFFLFFLAILLYIDDHLWFYKLWFWVIRFGVVFFSSPLQVVSLSLSLKFDLFIYFFELILDYFGSKNLILYPNTILAMLITDWHSSTSVQFSLLRSTLVNFSLLRSTPIQLGPFSLIRSFQSNSI